MNDKNATGSTNGTGARGCGRGEELVTYLYGESDAGESKTFRQHLNNCAVCREELAAFGGVREAVGEWRAEVLSTTPALDIKEALTPAVRAPRAPERKRSAMAALREFLSLSPLWLQAGAVAAALVVCALTALTFARTEVSWDSNGLAFRTGVKDRVIEKQVQVPVQTGFTQEQVNVMVEKRVSVELADAQKNWEADNNQRISFLETELRQQKSANRSGGTLLAKGTRSSNHGNAARNQLADAATADPFSTREERGVPHLTDLLGAVNAPQ
jgi:anti-sigma factor RsiW